MLPVWPLTKLIIIIIIINNNKTIVAETTKTVAVGGKKTAFRDIEKQGLFSTSVGSEESPPESEHQVFALSNFYTSS